MDMPVTVVNLGLGTKQLLLPGLVCQHTSDLIAVLLSLQKGDEMDAGPHLLAGEFTVCVEGMVSLGICEVCFIAPSPARIPFSKVEGVPLICSIVLSHVFLLIDFGPFFLLFKCDWACGLLSRASSVSMVNPIALAFLFESLHHASSLVHAASAHVFFHFYRRRSLPISCPCPMFAHGSEIQSAGAGSTADRAHTLTLVPGYPVRSGRIRSH